MTHAPVFSPPPSCCPFRRGRTPASNKRLLFIHLLCLKPLPLLGSRIPTPCSLGIGPFLRLALAPRGRAWRALVPWGKGALFVCHHSQGSDTWETPGLALMGVFSHRSLPLWILTWGGAFLASSASEDPERIPSTESEPTRAPCDPGEHLCTLYPALPQNHVI